MINLKKYVAEQDLALAARRELGIDPLMPIEDIASRLRDQGVTIIKKYFENSAISGLCSRHEDGTSAIMINSKYSLGRQNFTLAHEYYHLRFDKNLSESSKANEKRANKFASYFLMPQYALSKVLYARGITKKNQIGIEDILYLSNYFKVSYLAILSRLRYEEKIIDDERLAELSKTDRNYQAQKNGYSTTLYEPTGEELLISSEYVELANKAYGDDKISIGKYEEYLIEGGFEEIVFGLEEDGGKAHDGELEDYI